MPRGAMRLYSSLPPTMRAVESPLPPPDSFATSIEPRDRLLAAGDFNARRSRGHRSHVFRTCHSVRRGVWGQAKIYVYPCEESNKFRTCNVCHVGLNKPCGTCPVQSAAAKLSDVATHVAASYKKSSNGAGKHRARRRQRAAANSDSATPRETPTVTSPRARLRGNVPTAAAGWPPSASPIGARSTPRAGAPAAGGGGHVTA